MYICYVPGYGVGPPYVRGRLNVTAHAFGLDVPAPGTPQEEHNWIGNTMQYRYSTLRLVLVEMFGYGRVRYELKTVTYSSNFSEF